METLAIGLITQAPTIIKLVHDGIMLVEGLFGKGNGASKKQAATAVISDALNVYSGIAPVAGFTGAGTSEFQAALSEYIDATVKFYNATGMFIKSQK